MRAGRHRVVVVGGGFGGLFTVRALRGADVDVTLVDRRNFHLFQPLLYQVATGSLSPGEIAQPLRHVLRRQRNVMVLLGDVRGFDLGRRVIFVADAANDPVEEIPYDTLVVAAGARHSYFGHDEWEALAPGLKSIEDALEMRRRILVAFEAAEAEPDPRKREGWMSFVVVGGGPTGVELAGQIAEIAHDTVRRDFREIDTTRSTVTLVEGLDRLLTEFDLNLGESAQRQLESLGVTVRTGSFVRDVTEAGVVVERDGRRELIPTRTVLWAAGVAASPLARALADQGGLEVDRAGRVPVEPDLTLRGHPEVFVIGDMAVPPDRVPGVAPAAMQEGRHVAKTIRARAAGKSGPGPFRYRDKGSLATIGRLRGVAEIRGVRFSGLPAWLLWLVVHIAYLIGFTNRLFVLTRWSVSFFTHGRGSRLITGSGDPPLAGREEP